MTTAMTIVQTDPVETAWERYRALADAVNRDPSLRTNRQHCQAMIRAHENFKSLFLAQGIG